MNLSTQASVEVVASSGKEADLQQAQAGNHNAFRATGTKWFFGDILVGEFRLETAADETGRLCPMRYPDEQATNVVFVCEGAAHVTLLGSAFVFVAGSGMILPSNEIPQFFCADPTRILIVSLKGPDAIALSGSVPERPAAIAAAVIETHPAVGFLSALVATAKHHPIKTPPAGVIIAKLIASLLDADQDWHTRPTDPKVSEVLTLIDQHHTDPAFDVKSLARHLHTTPRGIELLMDRQDAGRRPSDVLLERRLVTAMTLLHPGSANTAEKIAFRSGFSSVAQLDDAIHTVYGLSTQTLLAIQPSA